MKTFWKICGWGALVIVLLFALILAVASPAAKYVVNNYGEQIVGRQMHVDRVIINPYWGGVTISGFECKEANGETNFVSFDRLYVHIAYPQLLGKTVKLRAIHLDGFDGQVLKHNDKVNFSDIIERFSKNDSVPADTAKSKWTVSLKSIRINNSNIRYRDVVSDKQWKLEDLTLRIPGLYFDNTQTNAGIEFGLPTGGRVGIIAGMKLQSNRYAVKLNLHDVHTDVVLPLVQDYLDVTGLGAKMNGSLHVDGSLDVISNILLTGNLSLTGLSLRDSHKDEVAALDELRVAISKGDIAKNTFILDSLTINGLTANYEVHEGWTTLTRLMKSKEEVEADSAATDSIETPIEVQKPRATKPLVWMAKRVTLTGHDISYHDYSMKHNWNYAIQTLRVDGQNVASNGRNAIKLQATLPNGGSLNLDFKGGLDLKNQDTQADLKVRGVHIEDFSALCRNYTGYPLDGGLLTIDSHLDVASAKLNGTNRIEIDHPRVGRKELLTKAPYKNIPVRLGFKMLTSAQDIILIDVPVKGDVTNPKFKLSKVIGRALLKVFFGPLMGVNDRNKSVNEAEMRELQQLLGEDSLSLSNDTVGDLATDVAMTAGDSARLTEVSE
ncbi:MAG: DUF748 domain-containing protein [Paludibacteraceae bacterium]|nr:DUF748 domain-containing protein [Paludibacteraceae bacterium]